MVGGAVRMVGGAVRVVGGAVRVVGGAVRMVGGALRMVGGAVRVVGGAVRVATHTGTLVCTAKWCSVTKGLCSACSGVSRDAGPSRRRLDSRETNSCRSTFSTAASRVSITESRGTRAMSVKLSNLYLRVSLDTVPYSCLYSQGDCAGEGGVRSDHHCVGEETPPHQEVGVCIEVTQMACRKKPHQCP